MFLLFQSHLQALTASNTFYIYSNIPRFGRATLQVHGKRGIDVARTPNHKRVSNDTGGLFDFVPGVPLVFGD